MTSPVTKIEIECRHCHHRFKTWHRASINLSLGDLTEEYVARNAMKQCPRCRQQIVLDMLVVEEDGTWRVDMGKDDHTA